MWQRGALDKGSFSREKPLITSIVYFFFSFFYHYSSRFLFPFRSAIKSTVHPIELDRWIVKLIGGGEKRVIVVCTDAISYYRRLEKGRRLRLVYWLLVVLLEERPTLMRRVYAIHGDGWTMFWQEHKENGERWWTPTVIISPNLSWKNFWQKYIHIYKIAE